MKLLQIGGKEITVEKKAIKNLYLRLTPEGQVRVSAPKSVGDETIRRFVLGRMSWIEKNQARLAAPLPAREEMDLSVVLPRVIARCEAATGLHAQSWRLRDMRSRWGSCNPRDKRITLNLRLKDYPEECLEYVVYHELTHLLVSNHSAAFWQRVSQVCPEWKRIRKSLNRPDV